MGGEMGVEKEMKMGTTGTMFPQVCEFLPSCDTARRLYFLSNSPLLACPLCQRRISDTITARDSQRTDCASTSLETDCRPSLSPNDGTCIVGDACQERIALGGYCGSSRVKIDSPLVDGHKQPRSLLVKTTYGVFHRDYTSSALLHVGVSNSQGTVYNFDEHGFHRDGDRWEEAIAVSLTEGESNLCDSDFDGALEMYANACTGDRALSTYHGIDNNCYDFVTGFLNFILYSGSPSVSKEDYCRQLLTRRIEVAGAYVTCFRRLLTDAYVVIQDLSGAQT
eukprot:Opistho-2@46066